MLHIKSMNDLLDLHYTPIPKLGQQHHVSFQTNILLHVQYLNHHIRKIYSSPHPRTKPRALQDRPLAVT